LVSTGVKIKINFAGKWYKNDILGKVDFLRRVAWMSRKPHGASKHKKAVAFATQPFTGEGVL
jgi:hypothetical protein